MNFSFLEGFHTTWRDILVIGKTIERDNQKYHIVGMTLSDEAKLYIIEPYTETESPRKRGVCNIRKMLKAHDVPDTSYLHCSAFYLGNKKMQTQGGCGGPLMYSKDDYGTIQLFFDMMSAGWEVPEWLKDEDFDNIQLVTITIAGLNKLPKYSPEMPITIVHEPSFNKYLLEKTITLHVGKSRSFSFTDHCGDMVQCHINNVTLIDVWKDTEKQFADPKLTERFSPEQIQQAKEHSYAALEQSCPKGMCYVGLEYECSKNLDLIFYSKQYLSSRPQEQKGSSTFFLMRLKPDQKTGAHGLPLKGCMIQTPLSPDTTIIPAELFLYHERIEGWTETV